MSSTAAVLTDSQHLVVTRSHPVPAARLGVAMREAKREFENEIHALCGIPQPGPDDLAGISAPISVDEITERIAPVEGGFQVTLTATTHLA